MSKAVGSMERKGSSKMALMQRQTKKQNLTKIF